MARPSRPWWCSGPIGAAGPDQVHRFAAEDALKAWTNARLGKFQRVSAVVFLDALPRNAAGKVLKRELRDRLTVAAAPS